MGRFGHIIAGFLSAACIMAVGIALGDGRSVITLKSNITHDDAFVTTLHTVLVTVYGSRYGVGVFHDMFGYQWDDVEHPLNRFSCDCHLHRGRLVEAAAFIAMIFSGVALIVHLLGAATGKKIFGLVGVVLGALIFVFFLISMSAGWALYLEEFTCKPNAAARGLVLAGFGVALGDFDLTLENHFELSYGIPFLIVGTVAGLLNIGALIALGALKDDQQACDSTEEKKEAHEPTDEEVITNKKEEPEGA